MAGMELAVRTWGRATEVLGWTADAIDHYVIHQVSKVHTEQLAGLLDIDLEKVFRIYPEFGNIGPAGVPIALSKLADSGRLQKGRPGSHVGHRKRDQLHDGRTPLVTDPIRRYRRLSIHSRADSSTSTGCATTTWMRGRAKSWSLCTAIRRGPSTTANLVAALRGDYRVVVPDHIGCGLSDKPGDDAYNYTLAQRIEDFGRLMDDLGLEDINLVVHDWGGMIGLAWAVQHPERIKRLVILNTAAFHLPKSKPLPWQLGLVRNTPLGALMVRGFNAFSRGASHVACTRKKLSKEIRDAYCAPYGNWADRIATLRFVAGHPSETRGRRLRHRLGHSRQARRLPRQAGPHLLGRQGLRFRRSLPRGVEARSTPMPKFTNSPTAATTSSRTPQKRSSHSSRTSSGGHDDRWCE